MSKQATKPATETSNAPVHTIRVNGIRASIWKNETDKGPRYNTTFERSYRDGEEWKNSDSYGREDLLVLAFVSRQAFAWIVGTKCPSTAGGNGCQRENDSRNSIVTGKSVSCRTR